MNAIPAIGNAIQNMGKKTSGVAQKGTKSAYDNSRLGQRMEYNKGMRAKKRSQIYSGTYSGNNPISRLRSAKNRLQNSMSGDFGKRLSDRGIALENKEEAEAITNAEQSLRRASTTNPAAAEEALKAALKSGDKVQAKAAQNLLFAQGSSGMRKFHSAVTEAQTNGSAHSSAVNALRENINANHGQMVKTKAMDVSKWASLGGDLAAHTSGGPNGDTWSGMSQADMAGQTGDSLQRAANAGKLDPVTASALLSNGQLNGNLDAKQKAALHQAAGTTVATQQASTTPQPTTVESVQTAAGGDAYDRRNAQRQEELSTQSAAGEIPDMPEEFRVWHEEQARRANPSAADRGSSTDEHGTQTPDLAAEDYHERMRGGGG
tara:strand:- start:88 stop:1215 length:1128 start_codon:yes stop_codon:yes gene_type:complete